MSAGERAKGRQNHTTLIYSKTAELKRGLVVPPGLDADRGMNMPVYDEVRSRQSVVGNTKRPHGKTVGMLPEIVASIFVRMKDIMIANDKVEMDMTMLFPEVHKASDLIIRLAMEHITGYNQSLGRRLPEQAREPQLVSSLCLQWHRNTMFSEMGTFAPVQVGYYQCLFLRPPDSPFGP